MRNVSDWHSSPPLWHAERATGGTTCGESITGLPVTAKSRRPAVIESSRGDQPAGMPASQGIHGSRDDAFHGKAML